MHRIQRHRLKIRPALARRLQPGQRKLRSNVLSRQLRPARTRPTPLQQVQRQKPHVRPNLLRINRHRSLPRRRRNSRNLRHVLRPSTFRHGHRHRHHTKSRKHSLFAHPLPHMKIKIIAPQPSSASAGAPGSALSAPAPSAPSRPLPPPQPIAAAHPPPSALLHPPLPSHTRGQCSSPA